MILRAWLSVPVLFVLILARSHGAEYVQTGTPPDAIFYNGHFVTVSSSSPAAQAVAVSNGKFVAVGSNDAVQRMAGPSTRRVDLQGRIVVPGLEDDHFH